MTAPSFAGEHPPCWTVQPPHPQSAAASRHTVLPTVSRGWPTAASRAQSPRQSPLAASPAICPATTSVFISASLSWGSGQTACYPALSAPLLWPLLAAVSSSINCLALLQDALVLRPLRLIPFNRFQARDEGSLGHFAPCRLSLPPAALPRRCAPPADASNSWLKRLLLCLQLFNLSLPSGK